MKNFKVITLGCKCNQYESDSIAMQLRNKGYQYSETEPDIVIVNTCTVTARAGMQSRQEIRKELKKNPFAKIIVTGCHAQTEPEEIRKINDNIIIVSQDKKNLIPEFTHKDSFEDSIIKTVCSDTQFRFMPSPDEASKTRAYLKIQDGCNAFCSYCIIPYARGRSRSMEFSRVIEELMELNENGYKEVVLTGIHIGCYGKDLKEKTDFTSLVRYLAKNSTKFPRLRISSIEPDEITDEIIEIASSDSVLCPHFHIPFQSGDDYILEKMKRPYSRKFLYDLTMKIKNKISDASIGADILLGFPGESDEYFENTFSLLKDLPVSYLHVFPFSPRKNTPAAKFKNQINGKITKKRCEITRNLSDLKKDEFYKSQSGRIKNVLIENQRDKTSGFLKGFTENYVSVLLEEDDSLKNRITKVRLSFNEQTKTMKSELY
ncbi:MAG: tRNA (N(6)-L-threonylcarbamoyladenosine(37)-C(2))-methylthiotransferase MtaB [Desulfobacteraceae bacterium]|nr:tRNA (N(6)-L-threonylcarbamoyladenosine(37)-C(2))-methylthiotransferase MtaB [Desulfobacteraceae bacterium]MCB9495201.1 tRNA (N(6)-L-threonylcarbamoyladenosine(37)-C(2))-methylthiotransferase MtaB [Desulfobacteraceae bacterium]